MHALISLKKFLDQDGPVAAVEDDRHEAELGEAGVACYRSLLLAVGNGAVQGSPALGAELDRSLQGLERRLGVDASPELLQHTQQQVEVRLQEWGERTAEHLKSKADEVKELLIALAKTAESVGDRNTGYTQQFRSLTSRLENIADLDDLTEIRTSLVKGVQELKTSVDQMKRDSEQLVAQLQAEVTTYETRLREVEHLVLKDELTGVANRRSVEERMYWNIANEHTFCVVVLDLNRFKQVNDKYGHLAGDDLLRQFATELHSNSRSGDLVGRWGGDEFVLLLSCDAAGANFHVERIKEWVFGKYVLQNGTGNKILNIQVDAAIGVAEWRRGMSAQQLIAQADKAMYRDKDKRR